MSRQRLRTVVRGFLWSLPVVVLAAVTVRCSDETPNRLQLNAASTNDGAANPGNAGGTNVAPGKTGHFGAPVMRPNVFNQCPDCPPNLPGGNDPPPPPPTPTPGQCRACCNFPNCGLP